MNSMPVTPRPGAASSRMLSWANTAITGTIISEARPNQNQTRSCRWKMKITAP